MSWLSNKNIGFIIALVLFSLPAILPLLQPGFFLSDDGEWMIIRFSAFHQAFSDGQFPVRFLSRLNHEYGYPVANFLYPGFMYMAEIPKLLGFGFVDSIKIILGSSMVLSAIFTYLWLSRLFARLPAFIGALFYLYAPYHLFDLYKRGSVGEVFALAIVPFILWSYERKSVFFTSVGVGALIIAHNTLALLFLPFIVGYMILRNQSNLKKIALMVSFGLGLAAFFWIPALYDLQYTKFFQTTVSNPLEHFADLTVVGMPSIVIFVGTLLLFLRKRNSKLNYFILVIGSVATFLSLSVSSPIWNVLPVSFVQFPFRFLSLAILSIAFLSASLVESVKRNMKIAIIALSVLALFLTEQSYITPVAVFDKGEGFYTTNMDTTTVKNEYMPHWVKVIPTQRWEKLVDVAQAQGEVSEVSLNGKQIQFKAFMEKDGLVRVNKIYFPGWAASVDNNRAKISFENNFGVMDVHIPAGIHTVTLSFGETPLRLFSDILSLASLLGLFVLSRKKYDKLF